MVLVGLTGGIGAGKSTVARMLADRGAVLIDADDLARKAVQPGTGGFAAVLEAFGQGYAAPDGQIDRGRLAALVFEDPEARRRLEAIIHPQVARLFVEATEPYRSTDQVVVYVVPLLVEAGLHDMFDVVVNVTAAEDVRVARLVADRGMSEGAARHRIAAQHSEDDRRRVADVVLPNEGSMEALQRRVEELWDELQRRADMIERS